MTRTDLSAPFRVGALAALPPGFHELPGARKVDAILDQPDPGAFVQSIAPEELYLLVQDIGLSDCVEIVALASPEQRVAFIDLDCWAGDKLDLEQLDTWIDVLEEGGGDLVTETLGALDPEVLVDYLLTTTDAVLDRSQEMDINAAERNRTVLDTPDFQYKLVLSQRGVEQSRQLARILDFVYQHDQALARNVLTSAQNGLLIENEELALHFRNSRLSDLGFSSPEEAHALFAPIRIDELRAELDRQAPPASAAAGAPLSFALARVVTSSLFLDLCAKDLPERDRFVREFALCTNHGLVVSAGGLALRDLDRVVDIARDVHATISLGLEYVAGGDLTRGVEVLSRAWVIQLHQAGHALASRRAKRARDLARRGGGLFEEPLEELLRALRQIPRPRIVDEKGRASVPASLGDLVAADRLLAAGEATVHVFETSFGFSLERFRAHEFAGVAADEKPFVRFATLARTLLAHVAAGDEPSFEPLGAEALRAVLARRGELGAVAEALAERLGGESRSVLAAAADSLTADLSLMPEGAAPDPRFLSGVVLAAR